MFCKILIAAFIGVMVVNASAPVYQASAGGAVGQFQQQQNQQQNQQMQASVSEENPFLEYSTRQGTRLFRPGSTFFFQDGGNKLKKRGLTSGQLKKTVVIFFGDWCPHCESFLKSFANHDELLMLSGVTVIYVAIPAIEKLKHWSDPTVDEFNAAENKIASFGLSLLSNRSFVTIIGERSIIASCGIEGLPVIVAVKNGEEQFRAVGESAISKLNFADHNVLKQFLKIWDTEQRKNGQDNQSADDERATTESDTDLVDENESDRKEVHPTKKKKVTKSKFGKNKKRRLSKAGKSSTKIDWERARTLTDKLNRSFDFSKLKHFINR